MTPKELEIATFRFGVIADFVGRGRLSRGERERLLQEKSSREYIIPYSLRTRISRATIILWVGKYKQAGNKVEGLIPQKRNDKGKSRALTEAMKLEILKIQSRKPTIKVPALMTLLQQRMLISESKLPHPQTVYRFIRENKSDTTVYTHDDRRAFEASSTNELWQSDVMHGPLVAFPDGKVRKSYLCALLDDHSRYVPYAVFTSDEKNQSLKRVLKEGISRRGVPHKLYVDNGAAYRSSSLEQTCALLGIKLKHSRPYTPQGRGKVERFFRTVRENFLPLVEDEELSLNALNERFYEWLEKYHNRVHSVTHMTPLERYRSHLSCIRPAPARLDDYFREIEFRKVRKDRTFQLNNKEYEAPLGLIDRTVELRFPIDDPECIEVFFQDCSYGKATLLSRQLNSTRGREWKNNLSGKQKPGNKKSNKTSFGEKEALRTNTRGIFGGKA